MALASVAWAAGSAFLSRNWQSEDGLPGSVVRSVVQSSDGFLWVATAEGIARFDGIEFESVDMPADVRWSRLGPSRLFATGGGVVWFSGHGGGLIRIDGGGVRQVLGDRPQPASNRFTQVIEAASGEIFAKRAEEVWLVSSVPPQRLGLVDAGLSAAFGEDLARRDRSGRAMPDNSLASLVDRAGRVWVRSAVGGLSVSVPGGNPLVLDASLVGDHAALSEMLEDREGNVWIASGTNGLFRLRENRVGVLDQSDGLRDSAVLAVIEHPQGCYWIGNRSGGVDRWQDGVVTHHDFDPGSPGPRRPAAAMHLDRDGRLWAASRDGSIFYWDGGSFQLAYPKQVHATRIDSMQQDGEGCMWFGGSRGLFRDEGGTLVEVNAGDGFGGGHVCTMTLDGAGSLWVATTEGRVFRRVGDRFVRVGESGAPAGRRASSMLVESARHAWVATLGDGLRFWDGVRWHRFDREHGLPDPRLTCILEDGAGNFWLGSLGGIFRVSRAALLARTRDPGLPPPEWLRIDRSDGLPTRECSGSAQPSGWRCRDGALRIPTARGLATIDPLRFSGPAAAPPVFIRELRANGMTLSRGGGGAYVIGPGRSRLEISFHGVGLGAPEEVTYLTRLRPMDAAWRVGGAVRTAAFESVPPGVHRFEVLAVNGDGGRSPAPAAVDIVVRPFFWQTSWFIALVALAVVVTAAGVGWMSARFRLKRRIQRIKLHHAKETERARIARDLHDDLGAKVTEISLIAGLAAENHEPGRMAESLDEISAKSQQLVGSLDEIVWAVNPREDTLRSLVDYLTASAGEFLGHAGIALRLEVVEDVPVRAVDSPTRHAVFLAVREALNNVVKHSGAGSVHLAISWDDPRLAIVVEDDGRGLPESPGEGHGLDNLRSRMADCGGSCEISSPLAGGSRVAFVVPLPARAPGGGGA